jgi:acyl-CoA dehydrogenase
MGAAARMALDQETFAILLSSVQRFVRDELVPNENRLEEENEVPDEIVQRMRDIDLFGLSIPGEYGGIGLTLREEVDVAYELGQAALAFRSVIGTNVGIRSQGILIDGTEEQKRQFLPRIASGEMVFSFALTEP